MQRHASLAAVSGGKRVRQGIAAAVAFSTPCQSRRDLSLVTSVPSCGAASTAATQLLPVAHCQSRSAMAAVLQAMVSLRPGWPSRRAVSSGQPACSVHLPLPAEPLLRRPQRRVPATVAATDAASSPGARLPAAVSTASAPPAASSAEEVLRMVDLLPQGVRQQLLQHPELPLLLEVVMDLGRAPLARFPSGDVRLAAVDEVVTEEQLQYAVQQVGEFGGDNRAGIDKTLVRGWRRRPLC